MFEFHSRYDRRTALCDTDGWVGSNAKQRQVKFSKYFIVSPESITVAMIVCALASDGSDDKIDDVQLYDNPSSLS